VPPLTVDGFREVIEVIGLLESWAARAAAQLDPEPRAALVAELRAVNDAFRAEGSKETADPQLVGTHDSRFHDLASSQGGPQLRTTLAAYQPRRERYVRSYMGYLATDVGVSADEHETIIDAIDRGDADAAERAVRSNRFRAIDRYATVIARMGERGQW